MRYLLTALFTVVLYCSLFNIAQANDEPALTKPQVNSVIKSLVHELQHTYLYPEQAKGFSAELLNQLYAGYFYDDHTPERLIRDINLRMSQAALHADLKLRWSLDGFEAQGEQASEVNAEISNQNIGYLSVIGSLDFNQGEALVLEALQNVSKAKVVIVDIREAEQLSIAQATNFLSYILKAPITVGQLISNSEIQSIKTKNIATQARTKLDFTPSSSLFVVTSNFVSREWELVLNALKQNDRATIVGEVTMGVSALTKTVRLNEQIVVELPYARLTGTGASGAWDNVGIEPEHYAKADEALQLAYELALKRLASIAQ